MSLSIGFTGTREGMSYKQARTLRQILRTYDVATFHHGDCVGADEEAHEIAAETMVAEADMGTFRIVVHPPVKNNLRAYCKPMSGVVLEPLPYHERNRAIVDAADLVLAAPKDDSGVGGTWQTINYAVKAKKRVYVIAKDGTYEVRIPNLL